MKLIDIPFIAETGTYYIDTDIVEDGEPVQVEFYVIIKYDYDEYKQSFNDLLIMIDCQDDELSHEQKRLLENQLYREICDYLNY